MKRLACEVGVACNEAASITVRPCTPPPLLLTAILVPLARGISPSGKRRTSMSLPAGRMHQPFGIVPRVAGSLLQSDVLAEVAAPACWTRAAAVVWAPSSPPESCRNRSVALSGAVAACGCGFQLTRTVVSAVPLITVTAAEAATNARRPRMPGKFDVTRRVPAPATRRGLAAGHRPDHHERLGAGDDRLGQWRVRWLMRQVVVAGEVAHE